MALRLDRITRAQRLMHQHGLDALLILTHDDYIYFFGEDRFQPRAIIPADGPPVIIAFTGEKDEVEQRFGADGVRFFSSVGGQIKDVVTILHNSSVYHGVIGVQTSWFEVPVSLLNLFQKVNPGVRVVDSAPVMDALRLVKEPDELAAMREAARIAAVGMQAAYDAIKPGVTENLVAAEAEYAMRKAGGSGTATPVFVNSGVRSWWLHGTATNKRIEVGDLVVIDLVPKYEGYCVNLTRSVVAGRASSADQRRIFDTFVAAREAAVAAMRPGVRMSELDAAAMAKVKAAGLGEHYVKGISHSIGLRFEETPAPTIHPTHGSFQLVAGMTITAGHAVLSVPGVGAARIEDTYLVTDGQAEPITAFPADLAVVGV